MRTGIAEAPLINITPLYCRAEPTTGYLIVSIPPSPRAPHMVTIEKINRFYGRNDKESYPLTEGEIARLYERRQVWDSPQEEKLNSIVNEMILPEDNDHIQLYVAVSPLLSDEDMLIRAKGKLPDMQLLNAALRGCYEKRKEVK